MLLEPFARRYPCGRRLGGAPQREQNSSKLLITKSTQIMAFACQVAPGLGQISRM